MITLTHNKIKASSCYIFIHKLLTYGLCSLFLLISLILMQAIYVSAATDNKTKVTKKNDDFKVSAEYGVGGYTSYDSPMQAIVTIKSSKDFTGILQLVGDTDYGEIVSAYGKRITLAAGEEKTYRLNAKPPTSTGVVKLSILNEREKSVYEEKTTISMMSPGERVLLGVLSDDYSGLGYLNGASFKMSTGVDYDTVSTLEFNKDSFPENAQILSIMSYLVIDNFDTSTLSEEQYIALKQWVADGGILILSLGGYYQNVLSGFKDDFVSGTLNDLGKKDLKWSTAEQEYTLGGVDCMDFVLDKGVEMTTYTTDKTAWAKSYGFGKVVVLSYSLSMEPFSSWNDRKNVAGMLLEEALDNANLNSNTNRASIMANSFQDIISISENAKKPSSILYGLLLTIYVILVGPILYLILKKKNIREKIWVAIPVVSLVFTFIIYCTSFIYRINKPLFNSITVIGAGESGAKETVYSEIVCPSAKRYDIKLNEEYTGFRKGLNQFDYGIFGNNNKSKKGLYDTMYLENGTDSELILNSDSAFDKFNFTMDRVINEGVGEITLDIECDWNVISGTITNNTVYDLKDVVITYESMIYQAGDMKKGETVKIDEDKIVNSTGYGTFDILNATGNNSGNDKLYRIDNAMEQVIDITNYDHGYVWGTIDSYKSELISDQQVKSSGMAVIFDSYYKEKNGVSGHSYSTIEPMIVDSQGEYDSYTGEIYENEVTITYSFEGYGDINVLTPLVEDSYMNVEGADFASCEAMNVDTGQFEPVFEDGAELSGEKLKKYLSHGVLILKFKSNYQDDGYHAYVIPRIAAFGN